MYRILSDAEKRALREEYETHQEYMVAYNAIDVVCEHYEVLSPEEIWKEALDVVDEISKSRHREWKTQKVFSQLKRRYTTFEDEHGNCITRTPEQQERTATFVLFDVVCMLSLAKRLEPEEAEKHPYYTYIKNILSFFCHSVLFQSMLAVLQNDEEEIEKMTGHELQEVDYMDGIPLPKEEQPKYDLKDNKQRINLIRKVNLELQKQLGESFKGKSQWFYVYRMLADNKVYDEKSYTLFVSDLKDAGVKKELLPDTNTFSRKQNQLKTGCLYPNWKVAIGGKQTTLDEGIRIAKIAFQIMLL